MLDTVVFLLLAVAYLAILAWGTVRLPAGERRGGAVVPLVVALALVYDNTVLGAGRWIGEGTGLEALNTARYWIHALVTPFLVVTARWALVSGGVRWAASRAAVVGALLLAVALVAVEVFTVLADLDLAPVREHGVLRYQDTTASGPPVMVAVVGLVLLVAGVLLWWRAGWPWLAVGSLVMVVGGAVPLPVESGALTNVAELVLIVTVVATVLHLTRTQRPRSHSTTDTGERTPQPRRHTGRTAP